VIDCHKDDFRYVRFASFASVVSTSKTLSWTAGAGATSRDVYFGTTNPHAV